MTRNELKSPTIFVLYDFYYNFITFETEFVNIYALGFNKTGLINFLPEI